jgi:hypothetical protein
MLQGLIDNVVHLIQFSEKMNQSIEDMVETHERELQKFTNQSQDEMQKSDFEVRRLTRRRASLPS